MDDFRLELAEIKLGTWVSLAMTILINGRLLEELAREVKSRVVV